MSPDIGAILTLSDTQLHWCPIYRPGYTMSSGEGMDWRCRDRNASRNGDENVAERIWWAV